MTSPDPLAALVGKLLPCPFCGKPPKLREVDDGWNTYVRYECEDGGDCDGRDAFFGDEREKAAAECWNRRATALDASRVGVWLLWKVYDYEPSSLMAAFSTEAAAEAMAARCRAHAAAMPTFPDGADEWSPDDPRWETDPQIIAWDRDTEAWRKASPIGGVWGGDQFAITHEPLLSAAPAADTKDTEK